MKKIIFLLLTAILSGCTKTPATNEAADANTQISVLDQPANAESLPDSVKDQNNAAETSRLETAGESPSSVAAEDYDEFYFVYNNAEIRINDKFSEAFAALGDYSDYFEAPSCAFEGIDKTYYYNGFEIMTYPGGDEDYIFSVALVDDNNTTPEGIYLGASIDDMIAAYGNDYKKDMGLYVYTKGETKLMFLTENEMVASITYEMVLNDE